MSEIEALGENPFEKLKKSAKMPPQPVRISNKQYGGQKAKFTKAIEVLEIAIKDIVDTSGYVTTKTERDHIAKYVTQAEESMEKVQDFLEIHGEHEAAQIDEDPDYVDNDLKAQSDDHDEKHKKLVEIQSKVHQLVRKYDQDQEKIKIDARQARSPAKSQNNLPKFIVSRDDDKFRFSDAIKPNQLSHEAKYLEYLNWHKNAKSYAEVNAMDSKPNKVQVSALFNILDEQLANHLAVQFNDGAEAPVFSDAEGSYLHSLKIYFQIKYPKPLRIFHYITAVQAVGESGPAWARRLEGLAIAAEATSLQPNDWLKFKMVAGMEHDPVTRDKLLLKCSELDLTRIKEKINEEAATKTMAQSLEKGSLYAQSQYAKDKTQQKYSNYRPQSNRPPFKPQQQRYQPQPQFRQPSQQRPRAPFPFQPRANQGQRPRQTFDLKCRKCNKYPFWKCQSHFLGDASVPQQRYGHLVRQGNFNAIEEDGNEKEIPYPEQNEGYVNSLYQHQINAYDVTMVTSQDTFQRDLNGLPIMGAPHATPLCYVRIKQLNVPPPTEHMTTTPTTEILAMFDTGATQSLMHIDLCNEAMMYEIDRNDIMQIVTANNQGIVILGSVRILIEYFGLKVREKVYICEGITRTHMFLSWRVGTTLQVLPNQFPLPIQHCNLDYLETPIRNPMFNPAAVQANFINRIEAANIQLQELRSKNSEVTPRLTFSDENNECVALENLNKLFESYSIVFDTSVKKNVKVPKMRLRYRKDIEIVPFKCTSAIPTPYALRDAARAEINGYVKDGIIAKVQPSEQIVWCAKSMFVAKEVQKQPQQHPRGQRQRLQPPSVRLVLDNRFQNKFLERDPYPFQSPKELAKSITPKATVFIVVDLWKGYYQCPLHEDDQIDTTFMVHEMGCYKFLRAPQGNVSSGDHFNRVTESLVEGIRGCIKLIDDVLIFGESIEQAFQSFEEFLKRCKEKEFTLHPRKLQIGNEVLFAGYKITPNGISIDDRKVAAIREFKRPLTVTDMKSFVGLAVQFKETCPNLMGILKPLMDTTSTKVTPAIDERGRKIKNSKRFIEWTPTLEEAFIKAKQALTNADGQVLAQYDPSLPLVIYTDASRLNGYGWIATQTDKEGKKKLLECGSASISDVASRNFSVTELELMAILLSLKKMRLLTEGNSNIEIKTDHLPLVGLHKKPLDKMETKRLMKMMEKLSSYVYDVTYISGVKNEIADCLSRYPLQEITDEEAEMVNTLMAINHANYQESPINLKEIKEAAANDHNYQQIVQAIVDNISARDLPPSHPGRLYRSMWHLLGTEDNLVTYGDRILIPTSLKKKLLQTLHATHLGMKKMFSMAQQLYFWRGMKTDIQQLVDACSECTKHGNFLPKETLRPQFAKGPMQKNAVDLAEYAKKSYLIHADRYSGYLWVYPLKGQTSSEVQANLWKTFYQFGMPEELQSDNAGQFTSDTFLTRCKNDNITQVFISPFMSQSNGFIEKMVHLSKTMIKKARNEDHLAQMVADYNQSSNNSGLSPSQILLKRNVRTRLPMLRSRHRTIQDHEIEAAVAKKDEDYRKQQRRFDRTAKDLPELQIGQKVLVYNLRTKVWDTEAIIIDKDENRSYQFRTNNNSIYWRNRRFIKEITRGLTRSNHARHQTTGGSCLASSSAFNSSPSFRSLDLKSARLRRRS